MDDADLPTRLWTTPWANRPTPSRDDGIPPAPLPGGTRRGFSVAGELHPGQPVTLERLQAGLAVTVSSQQLTQAFRALLAGIGSAGAAGHGHQQQRYVATRANDKDFESYEDHGR